MKFQIGSEETLQTGYRNQSQYHKQDQQQKLSFLL